MRNRRIAKIFSGWLILVIVLTACGTRTPANTSPDSNPTPKIQLLSDSRNKPTLTPFQPIPPTPTSGPTATPLATSTPTLQPTPTLASAVRLGLPRPEGQINILILGSDFRPGKGYRTDVMMVLSLNPGSGTASLVSFPRDLYVLIPGIGMNRINTAQPYGGFELTKSTLQTNFDVTVDYYMLANFNGFKTIVDTLGGINVYASQNLYDTCDLPQSVDKFCFIPAGYNVMDGATALWYVRSRESTNDFDRTRRAQEVISAIMQKLFSLNALNRGTELYNLFSNSVETNIPVTTIANLLPFGAKIAANPDLVKRYAIGPGNVSNFVVPESGAMVLIPDPVTIGEIIRQAFY